MAKYLVNIDLNKNELQNAVVQNLSTAPASPVEGQIYYNTADKVFYVFAGASFGWQDLRKVAGAGGSPITVTVVNGVSTINISPATASAAGSMSATDKAKIDAATANPTANSLAMRDGSGNLTVATLSATKVTGLAAPVGTSDAATKDYVDTLVNTGVKYKTSVRAATSANITLSGLQTIDGVSLAANERVLVKNQTTASANGIYTVASGTWTRTTDLAAGHFAAGIMVWVNEGTLLSDSGWVCISDSGSDIVGTNNLSFTQSSGVGSVATDQTLTKTGNTLSVTSYTVVSGSTVARKVVMTGSVGAGSAVTFTHNLNTTDYSVTVQDATTGANYIVDVTRGANAVQITAIGNSVSVRVTVIG